MKAQFWGLTMREIIVTGIGTGRFTIITPEVQEAINEADVVFADKRFAPLIPSAKKIIDIKNFRDLAKESGKILVLVSGDPGVFSLLPVVKKFFPDEKITVLPGISSLQVICAHACETWQDAAILSGHGRALSAGKFLNTVERNRVTILFCDRIISPSWACEKLSCIENENIELSIGSSLGGNDERFFDGKPQDFAGFDFPELSIVLVKNQNPFSPHRVHLRDSDFIREKNIVMTNESVRSVIMSRLELSQDSVFWDIGAGSGSISVSAANEFPFSDVHAVECKTEAATLILRNAAKFHLHNITIHNARALEVIDSLPEPESVFIGGSNGELSRILYRLKKSHAHVVIACVTLETFTEAYEILRNWENFEAVQISAVSSKNLTPSLTMMKAANPVIILSADGEL